MQNKSTETRKIRAYMLTYNTHQIGVYDSEALAREKVIQEVEKIRKDPSNKHISVQVIDANNEKKVNDLIFGKDGDEIGEKEKEKYDVTTRVSYKTIPKYGGIDIHCVKEFRIQETFFHIDYNKIVKYKQKRDSAGISNINDNQNKAISSKNKKRKLK